MALAVCLAAWGCSDPAPAPVTGSVADASPDQFVFPGFDVPKDSSDPGDTNLPGDADAEDSPDVTGPQCDFPPDPVTGQPGAACTKASDCDSGFCIETESGQICTRQCQDCCPSGFKCIQAGAGDPTFVCLPRGLKLCRPCMLDADCGSQGDDALCIDHGELGKFCGAACTADSDCPTDYACKDSQGSSGSGLQCVRTTGSCTCSPKAVAQGAATTCTIKNPYGSCSGARKCTADGLSACDAKLPAPETCNGQDDDCDGQTDEPEAFGCKTYWPDADKDGHGLKASKGGKSQCLCQPVDLFTAASASDCDDNDKAIHPGVTEVCNDVDDDCEAGTDEGCDDDKDGWCDVQLAVIGKPKLCSKGDKDCDDQKAAVFPGATETCGNFVDDDCNGKTDVEEDASGCKPFYQDGDKDGQGTVESKCLCGPAGLYSAVTKGDCSDLDPTVHGGQQEICGNGKDDDCDGQQDEPDAKGCEKFWVDGDSDGYGSGQPQCLCAPTTQFTVKKDGDCDDKNPKQNPAVVEACNGGDDDCDGSTDEADALGCTKLWADGDGDGFGNGALIKCLCKPDALYQATQAADCDDKNPNANPAMKEACNGFDDDCDATVDEFDAKGCQQLWADADGDGFGDNNTKACLCAKAAPYVVDKGGDCNDKSPQVHPAATEVCNGQDDECDGQVDEENSVGCSIFLYDDDGDGYGVTGKGKCLCKATKPYSAVKGEDCNDVDPAIKPGAAELCGDGLDNDCDGLKDELEAAGCISYYVDNDSDGYGSMLAPPQCLCKPSTTHKATVGGDCNDTNGKAYPKASEFCDGVDTDCNGVLDDLGANGCKTYYADLDGDGYGVGTAAQCACSAQSIFTALAPGDCNDQSNAVKPGQVETCNGIDDNCNGTTDSDSPSAKTFYSDGDGDGFGTGSGALLCAANGTYKVTKAGDCNDSNGKVYPTAPEVCNGTDDDCEGGVDEGAATSLCGPVSNGSPKCSGGGCSAVCSYKFADVNGQYGDGCECQGDAAYGTGTTCGSPISLGDLPDSGVGMQKSGNLLPGESGDWYHFQAVDTPDSNGGCDKFNVRVKLIGNPDGNFRIDLYRGGCAGAQQLCAGETDSGWGVNFYGNSPSGPGALNGGIAGDVVKSPSPEKAGECKCTGSPGLPGMNVCANNSADFFVRVYRAPGAPATCGYYVVEFTNGF